jgi:thiol-disulfide isomerase/thioredoxin
MSAPITRVAIAALMLAALRPGLSRAADAPPVPARALADSVAARYAPLRAYHCAGLSHVSMVPDSGGGPVMTSDMPFVFSARWPSRVHNEYLSPGQPVRIVADGDSLAIFAMWLNQYVVQAAPQVVPGQPSGGDLAAALQPLLGIGRLTTGLVAATDMGADTVLTTAGPVNVRRLELEYAPDSTRRGVTMLPRKLWVDPVRVVVWRDVISVRVTQPGQPAFNSTQSMRFVSVDVTGGGPDSLYRITPPEGTQRVVRLGPPPPPPPAIVGKLAPDFTLSTLAGTRVKLSALRGKVVVLDFWATWCGPCRRWMPIVAKLEKELRGRNVRFYAVNERDERAKVQDFLKSTGVLVPVLLDPDGRVGAAYDASSIPLTVIIGRNGKVVDALIGLHPEEDLRAALKSAGVTGL